MKINIFVSYCSANDNKMKALKNAIKKRKILNPIVVADRSSPKKSLDVKVKESITESDYIVPILTKDSINNQWVNQEIGYAYALGTKIRIFPIVEKSIANDLKGFIHNNLDLPYQYDSTEGKEAYNFRKCYNLLLDKIENLEDIEIDNEINGIKENLVRINTTNHQEIDTSIKININNKTTFNLRVKLTSPLQIFSAYYLIETDTREFRWIGYTNGPDIITHKEYTKSIQNNVRSDFYSINENVMKAVKERFSGLQVKPINIKVVRFRGDKKINELIRFYYTFSETT